MDVLIMPAGAPYVEGTSIFVPFVAIGRVPGVAPLALNFRVAYAFGATLAQKQTAIINAAKAARDAYGAAHSLTFPAVAGIEVIGIS